jgi:hypothetical protein
VIRGKEFLKAEMQKTQLSAAVAAVGHDAGFQTHPFKEGGAVFAKTGRGLHFF